MTDLQMDDAQAVMDTETMTADDWEIVEAIAQDVVATGTDVNELRSVVAYLSWLQNRQGSVGPDNLFEYLTTLAQHGEVRSKKTRQHYQHLERICRQYLSDGAIAGKKLLNILGWAGRSAQGRKGGRS